MSNLNIDVGYGVLTAFCRAWLAANRPGVYNLIASLGRQPEVSCLQPVRGTRITLRFHDFIPGQSEDFDATVCHENGVVVIDCPPEYYTLFICPLNKTMPTRTEQAAMMVLRKKWMGELIEKSDPEVRHLVGP